MKKLIDFFRTRIFKPNYCDWCGETHNKVHMMNPISKNHPKKLCIQCIDRINN